MESFMKPVRLAAIAVVLGAVAIGAFVQTSANSADKPAEFGRAAPSAEGRRADLAAFRTDFFAKDKSYSPAARSEAERRLSLLEGQIQSISQPVFELELARIAALADNGHTHYVLNSISRYYNRVPIRLATFGEDFYVVRALDTQQDLLGARLVAIDGHPIDELRTAARSLWGGPVPLRDRYVFELLESPDLLKASNLSAEPGAATYRFATPAGGAIERRLAAEPAGATRPYAVGAQVMFPQRLPLEDERWKTALTVAASPWSLRDWPIRFRSRRAPELEGLVLDFRQNTDANGFRIGQVIRQFEGEIAAARPKNLILDMRFNDGGDLTTTRAFMQSLPGKVPGRIFVLTSPFTFSAAIASVAYLEQAAPERVIIVGEEVGDRQMFFAEGGGIDLPHNKGMIGMGAQRHDYKDGCRQVKDCHRSVVRNPIAVASLKPDLAAPWTIEAYLAGRDPGMEAVAAALR